MRVQWPRSVAHARRCCHGSPAFSAGWLLGRLAQADRGSSPQQSFPGSLQVMPQVNFGIRSHHAAKSVTRWGQLHRADGHVAVQDGKGPATRSQLAADLTRRRTSAPLHFQSIAHRGACGKTRVVPHNRWPGPEPSEMGAAKAVRCCRRVGRARTPNGCGTSDTGTCKPRRPEPATAAGPTSGAALLVMATRFAPPAQAPCCAQRCQRPQIGADA